MTKKIFKIGLFAFLALFIIGVISAVYLISYYGSKLPSHEQLSLYNPPLTTRLYSADGKLLKEYAKEKRLFMPIEQIPSIVKEAFISAEDAEFYNHIGIDFKALFRAVAYDVYAFFAKKSMVGASTITQQVAKNFLLTNERSMERKIKEAILSIRMTQTFTKDKILELYLNQIFLGYNSYGVASAALNYFNKSLDELTIEEAAMLAALPKAPGKLDPTRNYDAALSRRNWVIDRMNKEDYITKEEATQAKAQPIKIVARQKEDIASADYFSEEVRKELVSMYGEDALLENGNVVTTTLDPEIQSIANRYLKDGIEAYDMRHGFRGAIANLYEEHKEDFDKNYYKYLSEFNLDRQYRSEWKKAVVLSIDDSNQVINIAMEPISLEEYVGDLEKDNFIEIKDDKYVIIKGIIPLKNLLWAKKYIDANTVGDEIKLPSEVGLVKGDVILVQKEDKTDNSFLLKQLPEVNGAVIAMDPHNGRVLAMMGGYIDSEIGFNRATQAERQPGSVIKTFAYIAALENGFTPASVIMDEDIVLDQGEGRPPYRPKNITERFYGLTTLRTGLERSFNVTTVRMASEVGLRKITNVIKRFGINKRPRRIYSIVLGSTETNLIKLVNAYAMIVNGGKRVTPHLIERIQDKSGNTIYRRDERKCEDCSVIDGTPIDETIFPILPDIRETMTDSATAYQITSMLEGVVQHGSAWRASVIKKPLGGKTGTTNNNVDSWFVGFTPDLVVGVFVGFDTPQTLGAAETGSSVSLPIFINIMKDYLKDKPSVPFRIPPTVKLVKIDRKTGYLPTPATNPRDIIYEAFKLTDELVTPEESLRGKTEVEEEFGDILEEADQKERMSEEVKAQEILDSLENGIY